MENEVEEGLEIVKDYNALIVNHLNMMYQLEKLGISKQELENYETAFEILVDKEKRQYQSFSDELVQDMLIEVNVGYDYDLFQKNGIIGRTAQEKRIERKLEALLYDRELEQEQEESLYRKEELIKKIPIREMNYNYKRNIQRFIDEREAGNGLRDKAVKLKYKHKYYEVVLRKYILDYPTMQMPYRDYIRASQEEKQAILDRLSLTEEELIEAYQIQGMKTAHRALGDLNVLQSEGKTDWNIYSLDKIFTIQSLLPLLTEENKDKIIREVSEIEPSAYTHTILEMIDREKEDKQFLGYYPIYRGDDEKQSGSLEEGR